MPPFPARRLLGVLLDTGWLSTSGARTAAGGFFGGLTQIFVGARVRFGGLDIDLLGKFGELLVGFLFFVKGLFEEGFRCGLSEQTCPGPYAAICRNFVVFDALRGGNERRIFHATFEIIIHEILAFLDESDHRGALRAAGLFAESLENLIETVDVPLGLFEVFFESGAKLLRVCSLGHFGKRLGEAILRVVKIFQLIDEQLS